VDVAEYWISNFFWVYSFGMISKKLYMYIQTIFKSKVGINEKSIKFYVFIHKTCSLISKFTLGAFVW
jgi:hypothetical protein